MTKYDERNTLFSRVALKKGSKEYKEYYKNNPKTKKDDDSVRNVQFRDRIKKSQQFKDLFLPITANNKKLVSSIFHTAKNMEVNNVRQDIPKGFTKNIKLITQHYGATDVGIAKLTDSNYYSHFGGVNEHLDIHQYGEKVVPQYKTAIVFTMEMDLDHINRAPHYEELMTTENEYLKLAFTGARLEMYLKELGYRAQSMNGEYYEVPLVPIAHDAGLGQIGMCNHIVTKKYGNRVRLGAVLTTLELDYDSPIDYGLHELCKKCALCLMNCPSRSITHKQREVNGRIFYKFNDVTCYEQWTKMGTDCGACIQACPLTQGVDLKKLEKMKDNPKLMDEIMEEHFEKYGRRKYIKNDLPIVSLEDDE